LPLFCGASGPRSGSTVGDRKVAWLLGA